MADAAASPAPRLLSRRTPRARASTLRAPLGDPPRLCVRERSSPPEKAHRGRASPTASCNGDAESAGISLARGASPSATPPDFPPTPRLFIHFALFFAVGIFFFFLSFLFLSFELRGLALLTTSPRPMRVHLIVWMNLETRTNANVLPRRVVYLPRLCFYGSLSRRFSIYSAGSFSISPPPVSPNP